MNAREKMYRKRQVLNLVRISNRALNVLRISTSNSYIHEFAKWKVFWELRKSGHDVITEAIFVDGGRADILDLERDGLAIEILGTETVKMMEETKGNYPVEKIALKAEDVIADRVDYWFI